MMIGQVMHADGDWGNWTKEMSEKNMSYGMSHADPEDKVIKMIGEWVRTKEETC